ncbi:hypothetical protein NRB56_59690 [Nocardia sp. RB56]|uniref:Uncharacterized protein n=2 Tax=Nocardia aurantia TaxID=2585199 RepID=A0A7K0DXU5_9NOCA|nr:hypothetical protein [Nocardia aurantia]
MPDDAGTALSTMSLALSKNPRTEPVLSPAVSFRTPPPALSPAYPAVDPALRTHAREMLNEAFEWCGARFPLAEQFSEAATPSPAIRYAYLRRAREGEYVGSSSAHFPGEVVLAAGWPLENPYWLASVIAHETVHHALFGRESVDNPVRPGSLGYSPWRRTTRPGRSVWHAFWTFTCQLSVLTDAVRAAPRLADEDRDLPSCMAAMAARIDRCLDSLHRFEVVTDAELRRCDTAWNTTRDSCARLRIPYFTARVDAEKQAVDDAYLTWAEQLLGRQTPVADTAMVHR